MFKSHSRIQLENIFDVLYPLYAECPKHTHNYGVEDNFLKENYHIFKRIVNNTRQPLGISHPTLNQYITSNPPKTQTKLRFPY